MEALHPCPYCGAVATVIHMVDTYDRADFGWDAGCPRWSLTDKHHDHSLPTPMVRGRLSKEEAIWAWNCYCSELKERLHNGRTLTNVEG